LPIIDRALTFDPTNELNQRIRQQVGDVIQERTAQRDAELPWYKRWSR
jgi:hypothetical protein